MKKGIFLIAVVVLLAIGTATFAVSATTVTVQIWGKFNQFASPIIPFNPDFRIEGGCFYPWVVEGDGLLESDWMQAWDATFQAPVRFPDQWDNFPNILMGDGYLAACGSSQGAIYHNLTYSGVEISDTEAWISLPGQTGANGGWHYIGIPYPKTKGCLFYDVVVTDGIEAHTLGELLDQGTTWLDLTFFGWNGQFQALTPVPDTADYLIGGQMYQVFTRKNNLALILPVPENI